MIALKCLGLIAPSRHGGPPLGADDYFNAVCKGDMFFSQLVGPTLGRVAILDARGRSPHVRSGRPPIVGPRGRGSLPRLPAVGDGVRRSRSVAAVILPAIAAAPAIATASVVATTASVAAVATAPAVSAIATTVTIIKVARISRVIRRAIAPITSISLNGARQGPHDQHCEKSGKHDTSPASLGVRIVGILVPTRASGKPSIGSWQMPRAAAHRRCACGFADT
jgi:hypothetical protein